MSRTTHLFVGAEASLPDVRNVIEAAVGSSFEISPDGEPVVVVGSTDVYLTEGHRFDDEDIEWPDGTWIKLRSEYLYWIEVRDVERNLDPQVEVARQVFQALKVVGRWNLVLIYDMQRILDSYQPQSD